MNWIRGHCIGRGAHGAVSLAFNKANGNIFAVKSVDQANSSVVQLQALENEIRILRNVSSPYIVKYLGDDTSWETKSSYRNLHMEYLPAGTVADVANIDEGIIRSYAWCIVSALHYLHSHLGIVHCDVKGQNILVGSDFRTAKLADFGSAIEICGTHAPRGSPMWMAPEVIRGEYQGSESDVWSFGCTVIEMVTGKPPWEISSGGSAADIMHRIGYSADTPVVPARLSEVGKDFLDKCLKREASERWSCDQLLRHPFLLSCSQSFGSQSLFPSPRGVLDWFSSEDECDDMAESKSNGENYEIICERYKSCVTGLSTGSGALWETNVDDMEEGKRNRVNYEIVCERYENCISSLASGSGVLWESNGWLLVREREKDEEVIGEGAILEYSDSNVDFERQNEMSYDDVLCEDGEVEYCQYGDEGSFEYGSREENEKRCDNWCKLLFCIFNFYIIHTLNLNLIISIFCLLVRSLQFHNEHK